MNLTPRELLLLGTGGRTRSALPLQSHPKVSVVIPCYNYGHYLPQCVYSVSRNQPGIELQIIIVDDASTDNSADIARQLAAEDDRITLIQHTSNAGHIATYNEGLAAATGDYVLLLSADDLATPGALTRAAALFEAEPSVGLVYGWAVHFTGSPPGSRTTPSSWIVWEGVDWLRERCRTGYNVVASPEVMMRTSVLRDIGGYRSDLPHSGDFEMWLRTACVSGVGFLVGVDQAFYRKHPQNMHRNRFAASTHRGQLVDLRQRWQSFTAVFAGLGGNLPNGDELEELARRTIRRQALDFVNYAAARGFRDFPLDDFLDFVRELDGDVQLRDVSVAAARRSPKFPVVLPLNPLWAPWAIVWRLNAALSRWRQRVLGI